MILTLEELERMRKKFESYDDKGLGRADDGSTSVTLKTGSLLYFRVSF